MSIRKSVKKWFSHKQATRGLTKLDTRPQNDLGINRSDIRQWM